MRLNVFLYEPNPSLQRLLKTFIECRGHRVKVFTEKYSCNLHALNASHCPSEKSCADVVIINTKMATREHLQILADQADKGCKFIKQNKAIMSDVFTDILEQSVRDLGFSPMSQPLKMAQLAGWLNKCAGRAKRQE